jgi:hypothetical protein
MARRIRGTQRLIDKQLFKRVAGKCRFCPCNDYAALHVHRIISGEDDGRYTEDNSVAVCANCHSFVHDGQILIDRYYLCTNGRRMLRIYRNGIEEFV